MTVAHSVIPGMTLEKHAQYRQNMGKLVEQSDKRVTMVSIPEYEGCECFLLKVKMPMFMTNRIFVNMYYIHERRNGSVEFIASSKGSEEIETQQAKAIGSDVIGNTMINYFILRPVDDGLEVWCVLCIDIGGSLPDALKRQGATESRDGIEKQFYTMLHGKPPKN